MAMAQKPTPRTRHMDIKYHVLVDWIERDLLQLERIDTTLNMANHFTKQLGSMLFHRHVNYILGKVPPTYSAVFKNFSQSINTVMKKLLPSPTICGAIPPHNEPRGLTSLDLPIEIHSIDCICTVRTYMYPFLVIFSIRE